MADEREQHGIGIEIDSSGAAAGEARVVRSLEHIKRKTKETGDAGAKAGGEAAAGFSRMGRAGEQAGRTMDSIRNKARQAGDAAAAAAGRAGSAWGAAFRRFQQMGAGGLGNVFAAMGRDADKLTGSTNNASGAFLRARLSANGLYTSLIALRNAAVVLVGVQLARKFLEVTDSMKRMQAQLRLTIPASMSMATAQKEVLGIAARTRTALEPITELYGRVARQVTEMGHGSEAAARATETVAKALKVSGASAIEQASVIRQLTQALASGVLRGDEFNAIMENSPRLAKLFADSIGVPVGALRKMAEEGEITAARLMKAMTDPEFTKKLDTEFRQLPITWEEAWIQIKNTAAVVLNAFDQGGQFSNALVNFAMSGSENIDDLSAKFEELGVDLRAIFAGLSGLFDPLSVESEGFFGFVRDQIKGLERAVEDVLAAWDAAAAGARNAVVGAAWTVPGLGPFLGPMANAMAPPATSTLDAYRASRDQSRAYGTRSMQERRFYSNLPRGLDWRTPGAIEMWSSGEFNKKPPAMPTEANDNASKSRTNAQALADFIHELNKQGLQTLTNPIRTAAQQNAFFRQGLTPLSGYGPGNISAHQNAQAVDLRRGAFDPTTRQKIFAAAQAAGIKGLEMVTESGGRRHLEWEGHGKPGEVTDLLRDQRQEAEKLARLADQRAEKEAEYWDKLRNEAKVAGMLPVEAEKYTKELELQLIRADGQLNKVKELSVLDKQRISDAVDLANRQKFIAEVQESGRNALTEQAKLLGQQQALSADTAEQAEEAMELEERMWRFKEKALLMGVDLQDETVKKALAELAAREKVNIEIARRNRLIQEGNDLVDDLLDEANPTRRLQREFNKNLQRVGASTRPQAEKDRALEQLNKQFAEDMNDIYRTWHEDMIKSVHQIADAFGGSFGKFVEAFGSLIVMVNQMAQKFYQAGTVGASANNPVSQVASGLQSLTTSIQGTMGPSSPMYKQFGNIAKGLGAISDGAAIGQQVAGTLKALGWKKFSTTGAEIGGGIGSVAGMVIGGPAGAQIGGFIGSFIGGTIGSLFKKRSIPRGSASITDVLSAPLAGGGHSQEYKDASVELATGIQQGLSSIANALGVSVGTFAVSIGRRGKNDIVVDPTGKGHTGDRYGVIKFEDEQKAIAYAILDAIKDGALKGLSEATARVLKGATVTNLNQLVQAAAIYEQLSRAAKAATNPMGAAFGAFVDNMKSTMTILKNAGYTYEELAALSGAFAEQQKQILEEMTEGYRAFLKEITSGPSSGKTIFQQFQDALTDFRGMVSAGGFSQDDFTSQGATLLDLAAKVYGTATPEYEAIRQELITATQNAIDAAEDAMQDVLNSEGIIAAIGDTNAILAEILNALYGRTTSTPPPTSGGTPTTTPPSGFSVGGGGGFVGGGGSLVGGGGASGGNVSYY